MLRTPPPASLNFLAGLFAAAGINMLTSLSTGPVDAPITMLVVDSVLWMVAAGFLTWAAHLLETADREAVRLAAPTLRDNEILALRAGHMKEIQTPLRVALSGTVLAVVMAVILLPRLFH